MRSFILVHSGLFYIIIIIITCRHGLPLLKPECADGAVPGKDSSITFRAQPKPFRFDKKAEKVSEEPIP